MEQKTLSEMPVSEISPNPHNPRLIFPEEEMDELKGSIKKVGILVPLTVYKNTKTYPKPSMFYWMEKEDGVVQRSSIFSPYHPM